jgi:rubrerythrin
MKRGLIMALGIILLSAPFAVEAQMGMGRGGMRGQCPMCGQMWPQIPAELLAPKSQDWLNRLREVLKLEKFSLAQYQADQAKYQTPMPYHMVIPQEEDHIRWIRELFTSYGLTSDGAIPSLKQSNTVTQAYQIAIRLEDELIPKYEALIQKAEDRDSARVLNSILYQTRMHAMMFSHAMQIGDRMGPGMMRRGR